MCLDGGIQMNLTYLKFFVSVAQIGSINQGATKLFISPQGLSRAIRQLETEIDTTLFIRDNDGLTLTPEGEIMLEYASAMLKQQEELTEHILKMKQENILSQTLHIGAYPIISSVFLPYVLPRFFQIMPNTKLQISSTSDFDLNDQLNAQNADIIIFTAPKNAKDDMPVNIDAVWNYEHLCTTTIIGLTSKKSPLAHSDYLTEKQFLSFQKVYFGNADLLVKDLDLPDETPVLKTSDYSLFRSVLAANQQAVGFSDSVVETFYADKAFKILQLQKRIEMEYSCFIQKKSINMPAVSEFIKILKRILSSVTPL